MAKVQTHHDEGYYILWVCLHLFLLREFANIETIMDMCKSDIYRIVVDAIHEKTEISEYEILGQSHRKEVVDARHLLVYFLFRKGFIPAEIARRMRLTPQAVGNILRKFEQRLNCGDRLFEISYAQISKQLETH